MMMRMYGVADHSRLPSALAKGLCYGSDSAIQADNSGSMSPHVRGGQVESAAAGGSGSSSDTNTGLGGVAACPLHPESPYRGGGENGGQEHGAGDPDYA